MLRKCWLPCSALALFALCVALKLNGSSVGIWRGVLKEAGSVRGLVLFKPKHIRIDEWSHITTSIIGQVRHSPPFPIENESLGGGRSPLLMSVPVAYYTTFFRPQLWGFFVFDIEHPFAFYWCCKVFGLLLATWWFLRQLDIKSSWIVAFGTLWLFFSSFVQWWFSSPALLPEMLASWAVFTGCALNFFRLTRPWQIAAAVAAFVFFAINFVLCLYPGFQVPLLYVSLGTVVGAWIACRSNNEWRPRQGIFLLLFAVSLVAVTLIPFWRDVASTLQMLANTAYPGVIRNTGGGLRLIELFSGFLGFFESEDRTPPGFANICEASNFYPLWVAVVSLLALARVGKAIPLSPLIIGLTFVMLLLIAYCFVPVPEWVARASLLGLTTERRLLLGIGVANVLVCCVFFDSYQPPLIQRSAILAFFADAIVIAIGVGWFYRVSDRSTWSLLIVAVNAFLLGLFFWQRTRRWFLISFSTLVIVNGLAINPVMQGLSPLLDSEAFRKIDKLHANDPHAGWIVYEDASSAQLIKATGARVFNGVKILPDLDFMRELDPEGRNVSIYNRFAYFNVELPEDGKSIVFLLTSYNTFEFTLPPEHPALRKRRYSYVVFPRLWLNPTLHGCTFVDKIEPSELYIYKMQPGSE